VHKAQVAAVRAYDAQLARINSLAQDAEGERERLANTLQ
jgi:hypothetical protein